MKADPQQNPKNREQDQVPEAAADPKNDPHRERVDKARPNDFYRYSGMAIKMAVVIFGGVYAGMYLDERWNLNTPWMTIVLSLAAVGVAIYIVIKDTAH